MNTNTNILAQDIIDSRDLIAIVEDGDLEFFDDDEAAEIQEMVSDGEADAEDWIHGATLIRDSYFAEYAQELAEDIGAISDTMNWPANCIDWESAASELQVDYTYIDVGPGWWVR